MNNKNDELDRARIGERMDCVVYNLLNESTYYNNKEALEQITQQSLHSGKDWAWTLSCRMGREIENILLKEHRKEAQEKLNTLYESIAEIGEENQ